MVLGMLRMVRLMRMINRVESRFQNEGLRDDPTIWAWIWSKWGLWVHDFMRDSRESGTPFGFECRR